MYDCVFVAKKKKKIGVVVVVVDGDGDGGDCKQISPAVLLTLTPTEDFGIMIKSRAMKSDKTKGIQHCSGDHLIRQQKKGTKLELERNEGVCRAYEGKE